MTQNANDAAAAPAVTWNCRCVAVCGGPESVVPDPSQHLVLKLDHFTVPEAVDPGNADVSSAPGPRRVISILKLQRFSRFALSADGTSAFPASADGLPGLPVLTFLQMTVILSSR